MIVKLITHIELPQEIEISVPSKTELLNQFALKMLARKREPTDVTSFLRRKGFPSSPKYLSIVIYEEGEPLNPTLGAMEPRFF